MASLDRQWELPAGYGRAGHLVTLREAIAGGTEALRGDQLTMEQRVALVRARWTAGEWSDAYVCAEYIDLARAERELEGATAIGRDLLRISERALDMVVEDASS